MNRPERILVFKTAYLGITFVLSHLLQIVLMLLQAAVIVLALSFVSADLAELAISLSLCPIAVAMHRDILLGEPIAAASYFPIFATGRIWKFLGFGILAAICVTVFASLGSVGVARVMRALSLASGQPIELFLIVPFSLIGTLVIANFTFVLPAVAVDQYRGIWAAKRMLSGNYWRVIAALTIVGLIGTVLNAALFFIDFSGLATVPRLLVIYAIIAAIALSMLIAPATLSFAYSSVLARQTS